jgi:hypothetical protein
MKTYKEGCEIESDINKHLPILLEYGKKCETIVEIGLREGISTLAFIEACPKYLQSIDIEIDWSSKAIQNLTKYAEIKGVEFHAILGDSRKGEIIPCDMLFIDGEHTYEAVKKELELHPKKVKKYIGFHDVVTFGYRNEVKREGKQGINYAIEEFLEANKNWVIDYVSIFCNGLLVLKNTDNV